MVGSLGVIPNEPLHQSLIEAYNVVREYGSIQIGMLLLYGAVEPLDERIHLGSPRIGMEVWNTECIQFLCEVLCKLASIVGLDATYLNGNHCQEFPEEVSGRGGRQCLVCIGKGEITLAVYGGEYIATYTVFDEYHRVDLHKISRILWSKVLETLFGLGYASFVLQNLSGSSGKVCLGVLRQESPFFEVLDDATDL